MNTMLDSAVVMPDVQSSVDLRHIPIQRVGVRSVRQPMMVAGGDGKAMPTVGDWELTVALPAEAKGTHMSRFLALLDDFRDAPLTPARFWDMHEAMLPLLNARAGDIVLRFPYFIRKAAPVTGVTSLMDYELTWTVRSAASVREFELQALVPVTSLCPCSKAIAEYGAHNQRSHVIVTLVYDDPALADIDSLIRMVEQQASSELWGLLKRADEKYVTERAYENPKFVEDLVRDVAQQLARIEGASRYSVSAENFESIHNHSAYAFVEGDAVARARRS